MSTPRYLISLTQLIALPSIHHVLMYYVFNYVFSFNCSCLFATVSVYLVNLFGYFLLGVGRPTVCGTNLSSMTIILIYN